MVFGVCLNSLATAARERAASSRNGLSSYSLGKLTVTDVSRPLFQLKPTFGFTPVASAMSASTALACLNPSVMVLTASHPASAVARMTAAMAFCMFTPDQFCLRQALGLPPVEAGLLFSIEARQAGSFNIACREMDRPAIQGHESVWQRVT